MDFLTNDENVFPYEKLWLLIQSVYTAFVAVALLTAPHGFLSSLGWQIIDVVAARLLSVSFLLIAITSFHALSRSQGLTKQGELRKNKLSAFFMLWNVGNTIVMFVSTAVKDQEGALGLFPATIVSFIFAIVWTYYWASDAHASSASLL